MAYRKSGQLNKAVEAAEAALALYQPLSVRLPGAHLVDFAKAASHLAELLEESDQSTQVLSLRDNAVAAYRAATPLDPHDYRSFVGELVALSQTLFNAHRELEATARIEEAEAEGRLLCQEHPGQHEDALAWTLSVQALIYSSRTSKQPVVSGIADKAEQLYADFLRGHPERHDADFAEKIRDNAESARSVLRKMTETFKEFAINSDHGRRDLHDLLPPEWHQAEQAARQAESLLEQNKFAEAARLAQDAVTQFRELAVNDDRCESIYDMASLLVARPRLPANVCAIRAYALASATLASVHGGLEDQQAAEEVLRAALALITPEHLPYCGDAYVTVTWMLGRLITRDENRSAEALSVVEGSVGLSRSFAQARPYLRARLVDQLLFVAMLHAELGDSWKGCQYAREAVEVCRAITGTDADGAQVILVQAHLVLATLRAETRQIDETALADVVVAGYLLNQLTPQQVDEVDEDAGKELDYLFMQFYRALGGDMSITLEEARATVYRGLYEHDPKTHCAGHAATQWDLVSALRKLGDYSRGCQTAEECVALYRMLHEIDPTKYQVHLASVVGNHALVLAGTRCFDAALQASTEAVRLWRALADEDAATHETDYAWALTVFVEIRTKARRELAKALDAAREAVAIHQRYAGRGPAIKPIWRTRWRPARSY